MLVWVGGWSVFWVDSVRLLCILFVIVLVIGLRIICMVLLFGCNILCVLSCLSEVFLVSVVFVSISCSWVV